MIWSKASRGTAVTGACLAVLGSMLMTSSPAVADPDLCGSANYDRGTGGDEIVGPQHSRIWGTWINCGAAVDHVRIDVDDGIDGPCISVHYGTRGSASFTRQSGINDVFPKYRGWYRC
jgi:hypothetical protein